MLFGNSKLLSILIVKQVEVVNFQLGRPERSWLLKVVCFEQTVVNLVKILGAGYHLGWRALSIALGIL